jgi:hypothetical protein
MGAMAIRCIVTLALSLLLMPLVGEAQPTGKVYRIGWLSEGVRPDEPSILEALRVLGYVEGHNLVVERRYAEQGELLPVPRERPHRSSFRPHRPAAACWAVWNSSRRVGRYSAAPEPRAVRASRTVQPYRASRTPASRPSASRGCAGHGATHQQTGRRAWVTHNPSATGAK